jgi:hypothetical protein
MREHGYFASFAVLYFSRSFGFSIFPVTLRGTVSKMNRRGLL